MDDLLMNQDYYKFFIQIKEKIYKAQYEALRALNKELIKLYWDIGKEIVEKQEQFGWGKSVVEVLAQELQNEFPGIKGFSLRNLWNMRNFYLSYNTDEKTATIGCRN